MEDDPAFKQEQLDKLDKELSHLKKKEKHLMDSISVMDSKLENEKFVGHAPVGVVKGVCDKLKEMRDELDDVKVAEEELWKIKHKIM
jgi:valyl-tRNA synthetase